MTLLKLYEEILKTGMMTVDENGLVSQPKSFEEDGTQVTEPTLIEGKRLVLPVQEHINHPDRENKIIFHPLNENALQGESAVISKLKTMCSVAVNMAIFSLLREFMSLALSTEMHKKLSPDQSEILSILKNMDEKSEKDFIKIILNGMKKHGSENLFFKVFLKRGGTVMGKKYSRVGVVSFPMYEELCNAGGEHFGVSLRKKDQGVFKALMEYILPKISEEHAYDQGSDDFTAPYLDALMQSIASVASDINRKCKEFEGLFEHPNRCKVSLTWQKEFMDLSQFQSEIRRIPAQPGNQGSRKVEDKLKEEHDIQSAVNQALHKNTTSVDDNVPPWENAPSAPSAPMTAQPQSEPQGPRTISANDFLSVGPYNPQMPVMPQAMPAMPMYQGMPMQPMMPMQQGMPMQASQAPNTISVNSLLGMPQGYPQQMPYQPGYGVPQQGYGMPQQQMPFQGGRGL